MRKLSAGISPRGSLARYSGRGLGKQSLSSLGMIPVLLLLCVLFSILTWTEQYPTGASAARQVARSLTSDGSPHLAVLIVVRDGEEDAAFADTLRQELRSQKALVVGVVRGQPIDVAKRSPPIWPPGKKSMPSPPMRSRPPGDYLTIWAKAFRRWRMSESSSRRRIIGLIFSRLKTC